MTTVRRAAPARPDASSRRERFRVPAWSYVIVSLAVGIGIWWLAAVLVSSANLPSPGTVARVALCDAEGVHRCGASPSSAVVDLPVEIWASLQRVLLGYLIGVAAAIPAGFVMGWYRWARMSAEPWVQFFRTIPPLALIPVVIVALGVGETAKVFLIFLASFLVTLIAVYQGVRQVERTLIDAARVLGARERNIFARVVVPAAVPYLMTGMRIALGSSWATVVAAEMIAANHGLGQMMMSASNNVDMPTILIGVILIGVLGIVMDRLVQLLEWRVTRWQDKRER